MYANKCPLVSRGGQVEEQVRRTWEGELPLGSDRNYYYYYLYQYLDEHFFSYSVNLSQSTKYEVHIAILFYGLSSIKIGNLSTTTIRSIDLLI